MKANEIKSEVFNCYDTRFLILFKARQQYKLRMQWGEAFPTTKTQAKFFIANNLKMGMMTGEDVKTIENLCARHGMENQVNYKYTRSQQWVRVCEESLPIIRKALELEYGL